jgi:hypothetical protein
MKTTLYFEYARQTLKQLGFEMVREREHIAMVRENPDGTRTALTMPNHSKLKSSPLRTICTQANINRKDFLKIYEQV